MRKIFFTFLCFINIIFLFGQSTPIFKAGTITVMHYDKDKDQVINPDDFSKKGRIEIFVLIDGDGDSEKHRTTFDMGDDINLFEEDDEMTISNIKEVTPPDGYYPCIKKEVYYFNTSNNLVRQKALQPDDPIDWRRGSEKYFAVVFINEKMPLEPETETFWYRFKGGEGWEGNSPAQIAKEVTAVRVGEYFWMNTNFNLYDPYAGNSVYPNVPITEQTMENYFKTLKISDSTSWKDLYNVTPEQINSSYGYYFEKWGTYRLWYYGIFSNDQAGSSLTHSTNGVNIRDQWRLPFREEVRQLYAMCPFLQDISGYENHTVLNEMDIRRTLGAKTGDNPCAKDFCDINNPSVTRSYWYDSAINSYKYNMMPSGWRSMIYNDWFNNDLDDGNPGWWMAYGDIAQMFYTVYTPVGSKGYPQLPDDVVTLAEHVSSKENNPKSWKRFTFRWVRAMTDAELGYKLYVKVTGLAQNSEEWTKLAAGDEIPLLIAVRNGIINPGNIDIQKRNLGDITGIDANYIELPKGYLRGFYVQYNINGNNSRTSAEIAAYASNVEDNALGYKAWWQQSAVANNVVTTNIEVKENAVTLYPNPVHTTLSMSTTSEVKSVKIFNQDSGKLYIDIKSQNINSIDVSSLPGGIYVIYIETAEGIESHKVIKL